MDVAVVVDAAVAVPLSCSDALLCSLLPNFPHFFKLLPPCKWNGDLMLMLERVATGNNTANIQQQCLLAREATRSST